MPTAQWHILRGSSSHFPQTPGWQNGGWRTFGPSSLLRKFRGRPKAGKTCRWSPERRRHCWSDHIVMHVLKHNANKRLGCAPKILYAMMNIKNSRCGPDSDNIIFSPPSPIPLNQYFVCLLHTVFLKRWRKSHLPTRFARRC